MKKLIGIYLVIFIFLSGFTFNSKAVILPDGPAVIALMTYKSCTGVYIVFDITDDGGNPVIKKGVCCGTALNPTTADKIGYNNEYTSFIGGIWYHNFNEIDGLLPGTSYHARPFFVTSAGTFYGNDISFTTNPAPVVTTDGITEITGTTAIVHGNITSTGGSNLNERGIIWDTIPNLENVKKAGSYRLISHFSEQTWQSPDRWKAGFDSTSFPIHYCS